MLNANKNKELFDFSLIHFDFFCSSVEFCFYFLCLSLLLNIKMGILLWPLIFGDYFFIFHFVIILWNYENQEYYEWIVDFLCFVVHVKIIGLLKPMTYKRIILSILISKMVAYLGIHYIKSLIN